MCCVCTLVPLSLLVQQVLQALAGVPKPTKPVGSEATGGHKEHSRAYFAGSETPLSVPVLLGNYCPSEGQGMQSSTRAALTKRHQDQSSVVSQGFAQKLWTPNLTGSCFPLFPILGQAEPPFRPPQPNKRSLPRRSALQNSSAICDRIPRSPHPAS